MTYWLYQYANHQNKYSIGRSLSPCKHGAEDELGCVDGGELAQRLKVAVGKMDEETVVWFPGPTCGEGEERLNYTLPRLLFRLEAQLGRYRLRNLNWLTYVYFWIRSLARNLRKGPFGVVYD